MIASFVIFSFLVSLLGVRSESLSGVFGSKLDGLFNPCGTHRRQQPEVLRRSPRYKESAFPIILREASESDWSGSSDTPSISDGNSTIPVDPKPEFPRKNRESLGSTKQPKREKFVHFEDEPPRNNRNQNPQQEVRRRAVFRPIGTSMPGSQVLIKRHIDRSVRHARNRAPVTVLDPSILLVPSLGLGKSHFFQRSQRVSNQRPGDPLDSVRLICCQFSALRERSRESIFCIDYTRDCYLRGGEFFIPRIPTRVYDDCPSIERCPLINNVPRIPMAANYLLPGSDTLSRLDLENIRRRNVHRQYRDRGNITDVEDPILSFSSLAESVVEPNSQGDGRSAVPREPAGNMFNQMNAKVSTEHAAPARNAARDSSAEAKKGEALAREIMNWEPPKSRPPLIYYTTTEEERRKEQRDADKELSKWFP